MIPINRYLDAAVLKPETSREEAIAAIQACITLDARTVCVRPCDIALASELCAGTSTDVCVVLGFPHGDQLTASKADEARQYVKTGVHEIDMVANYGWARSGFWDDVEADIRAVVEVAKPAGIPVKVIFETSQLDHEQITALTHASLNAGATFVKTSTGFNGGGATEDAIRTMLQAANGNIQVKASGGIRDRATAEKFIAMGVGRLGVNWASCEAICSGGGATGKDNY